MRGRLSAAGATAAGALLVLIAGCGEPPVSPLPIQTPVASAVAAPGAPPGATPTASATPVATAAGQPRPAAGPRPATTRRRGERAPTTSPTTSAPTAPPSSETPPSSPDCLGAEPYDVDATGSQAPPRSLCVEPGATLRVSHVGPGEVTAEPADLVSRAYEGDVESVTFAGAGTVTVGALWAGEPYVIEVEVRPSPSPQAAD